MITFTSQPAEVEPHKTVVMSGTSSTLELVVRADTLPIITWLKGSTVISNDLRYNISETVEEEQGQDHYYKVKEKDGDRKRGREELGGRVRGIY